VGSRPRSGYRTRRCPSIGLEQGIAGWRAPNGKGRGTWSGT